MITCPQVFGYAIPYVIVKDVDAQEMKEFCEEHFILTARTDGDEPQTVRFDFPDAERYLVEDWMISLIEGPYASPSHCEPVAYPRDGGW